MPRFRIHHITKYTYEAPVRDSANQIMLFPVKDQYQEVIKQELTITNEPNVDVYHDYYGNQVGCFMHTDPHDVLEIDSKVEVITHSRELPNDETDKETQWQNIKEVRFQVPYIDFLKLESFDMESEVKALASREESRAVTPYEAAKRLNSYIYENFKYIKGVTSVESTLDEVWELKAGVCQDFAHILLIMLRMIDIPARYVSGYVCPNHNGMRGEGATHAWVEAYIPFYGWLGLDPTNNCIANGTHIRLAVGRSFSDCSPVRGTFKGGASQRLEVGVSVGYENGEVQDDVATVLTPQPIKAGEQNSYRMHLEMIQMQQQQ